MHWIAVLGLSSAKWETVATTIPLPTLVASCYHVREERYSTIEKGVPGHYIWHTSFPWPLNLAYKLSMSPFVVQTDHRSMRWMDQHKHTSSRLTRWSLTLQFCAFKVGHRTGCANENADALSRKHTRQQTSLLPLSTHALHTSSQLLSIVSSSLVKTNIIYNIYILYTIITTFLSSTAQDMGLF